MPGASRSQGSRSNSRRGGAAVERPADWIDHSAEQGLAHGRVEDAARPLNPRSGPQPLALVEQHAAHLLAVQVEREAAAVVGEPQQLVRLHVGQPHHVGDPPAHFDHDARFAGLQLDPVPLHELGEPGAGVPHDAPQVGHLVGPGFGRRVESVQVATPRR